MGGAAVTEEVFPGFKFSVCSYVVSLMKANVIRELMLPKFGLVRSEAELGLMVNLSELDLNVAEFEIFTYECGTVLVDFVFLDMNKNIENIENMENV